MSYHIVIPARFGSTRFPGKPLAMIAGKSLIERVVESAKKLPAASLTVATDDERIKLEAERLCDVVMTRSDHESGTDRLAEVAKLKGWSDDALVVNIQGDEPEVDIELIQTLVQCAEKNPDAALATVVTPVADMQQKHNPNVVKAVLGGGDGVLYFSRSPIPYCRDDQESIEDAYRHLGIYAYRVGALKQFSALPVSQLESIEKLEQLRFMTAGLKVVAAKSAHAPLPGIDTPADLAEYERFLEQQV